MTDDGPMSLAQLRVLGAKASGDHEARLVELERRLAEAEARLTRRTANIRTLVAIVRAIAAHVGYQLTEEADGRKVQAPVREP